MSKSTTGKVDPCYGRTPHALLDANLGHRANAVFQALAYFNGGGIVNPSLRTIGKVAGLSENPVRKGLKVLTTTGWVEEIRHRKGYRIAIEYRLRYTAPTQLTLPLDDISPVSHLDTGPVSHPGVTKKRPGVTIGHPPVSHLDTKQERTRSAHAARRLPTPNPPHGGRWTTRYRASCSRLQRTSLQRKSFATKSNSPPK